MLLDMILLQYQFVLYVVCFQSEIRSSLVLSMLQQMLDDKVEIVREAAVRSLGLVFSLIEDTDKYNQVKEAAIKLTIYPIIIWGAGPGSTNDIVEVVREAAVKSLGLVLS